MFTGHYGGFLWIVPYNPMKPGLWPQIIVATKMLVKNGKWHFNEHDFVGLQRSVGILLESRGQPELLISESSISIPIEWLVGGWALTTPSWKINMTSSVGMRTETQYIYIWENKPKMATSYHQPEWVVHSSAQLKNCPGWRVEPRCARPMAFPLSRRPVAAGSRETRDPRASEVGHVFGKPWKANLRWVDCLWARIGHSKECSSPELGLKLASGLKDKTGKSNSWTAVCIIMRYNYGHRMEYEWNLGWDPSDPTDPTSGNIIELSLWLWLFLAGPARPKISLDISSAWVQYSNLQKNRKVETSTNSDRIIYYRLQRKCW